MKLFKVIGLTSLIVAIGCAEALPKESPEIEVRRTSEHVDRKASETMDFASAARLERERAEEILREAQLLVKRAEGARDRCEGALRNIEQRRRSIAALQAKKAAEETAPPQTPPSIFKSPTAPQLTPPVTTPQLKPSVPSAGIPPRAGSQSYSPSDAPLTDEEIEALRKKREAE